MERKVGEVFNDGEYKIQVIISDNGNCTGCHYWGSPCDDRDECCKGLRSDGNSVIFKKIGESKMETEKQMLLKQIEEIEKRIKDDEKNLQEQEQRRKDNQKTLEEMRKKVEKLEEEQPTVSATGVYLDNTMECLYSLDYDNSVLYQLSMNSNIDVRIKKLNLNNAFVNEKSAKQEALRREGQEFIRRCAMLRNKGNDWRKQKNVRQFFVDFDTTTNKLGIAYNIVYTGGAIFFDTYELAEKCITELKAKYNEEQIKTIFGVI